ncbi:MAG: chemotaxis protein [Rhodospirillaceae bacterium]
MVTHSFGEHLSPYFDHDLNAEVVQIVIGEYAITSRADQVLVTTLGSCVAACARDPVAGIGGMNHFLLPESVEGAVTSRYGRTAMDELITALVEAGCRRERLEFKVFGAARTVSGHLDIGLLNADFILSYLKREGLTLVGRDLGGAFARQVFYYPLTGRVRCRVLRT